MKKRNHKKSYVILFCMLLMLCMIPTVSVGANYLSCEHHAVHDSQCGGTADKCTYACDICMAEVQELLDQLPSIQDIKPEDAATVGAKLSAIDAVKMGLSDAAMGQVDFTKYSDAAFVLSIYNMEGWFGLCIEKKIRTT